MKMRALFPFQLGKERQISPHLIYHATTYVHATWVTAVITILTFLHAIAPREISFASIVALASLDWILDNHERGSDTVRYVRYSAFLMGYTWAFWLMYDTHEWHRVPDKVEHNIVSGIHAAIACITIGLRTYILKETWLRFILLLISGILVIASPIQVLEENNNPWQAALRVGIFWAWWNLRSYVGGFMDKGISPDYLVLSCAWVLRVDWPWLVPLALLIPRDIMQIPTIVEIVQEHAPPPPQQQPPPPPPEGKKKRERAAPEPPPPLPAQARPHPPPTSSLLTPSLIPAPPPAGIPFTIKPQF